MWHNKAMDVQRDLPGIDQITNSRRRKQIDEFVDQDHAVMNNYYEILDQDISDIKLKNTMQKLIDVDPDFYDPYSIVADFLFSRGKDKQALKLLKTAFRRAVQRVVDNKGNLPKRMEWGWFENRHIIRAIDRWAYTLWGLKETDKALEIYRKILRFNPNDNTDARNYILAMRLGLEPDFENQFASKNMPGYIDALKISDWFDENAKNFPDEFEWWFKQMQERNE